MKFNPAQAIQDLQQFGEFGGVNPSITDSSTYTFLEGKTMEDTFHGKTEGCFLYSRHWNPSNKYLADALAAMENTESDWITSSGMAAITCSLLQLCNSGDHIVTSVTTYGGTYAFLKNWLPKYNIQVSFVDITNSGTGSKGDTTQHKSYLYRKCYQSAFASFKPSQTGRNGS